MSENHEPKDSSQKKPKPKQPPSCGKPSKTESGRISPQANAIPPWGNKKPPRQEE